MPNLKQRPVEWGLLQIPQENDRAVVQVLATEDACNTEAAATLTFLFASVTSDDRKAIDSLKTCDCSRGNSNKNVVTLVALSLPGPLQTNVLRLT